MLDNVTSVSEVFADGGGKIWAKAIAEARYTLLSEEGKGTTTTSPLTNLSLHRSPQGSANPFLEMFHLPVQVPSFVLKP